MEQTGIMRLKRWQATRWHPLLVDALLAVVLAGCVLRPAVLTPGDELAQTVSAGDVLVAVVAFLAVLQRRRRPRTSLTIATATTVGAVTQGVDNPGLIVVLGVITYSIAAHTNRRAGWTCALAAASAVYAASVIISAGWRPDVLGVFAWIFMAAAVGDAARMHRAYVSEVEARAHRAEQTREQEAERRVINERLRIARELHDVVAHHIAVISVQAGAATHVLRHRPDQVGPALEHIRDASDLVLKEIASVVGVLRSSDDEASTEPTPGLSRLPDLIGGLEAAGFSVRRQQRGEPRELPAMVDLAAYRIVQEGLTNAHKYGAGRAGLLVEYAPGGVILEVTNDVRSDRGAEGSGYGLLGMRERATAAGGTVTAGPLGDGRFRVHAVLPTGAAGAKGCGR